jgi:hypothetical protein
MKNRKRKEVSWGIYEEDDGSYSLYEFYSGKVKNISKKYQEKIRAECSIEEMIKKLIK